MIDTSMFEEIVFVFEPACFCIFSLNHCRWCNQCDASWAGTIGRLLIESLS